MKPSHVVAVSMFRNEEDVAPYVVRHMLDQCDRVIVADNCSTDATGQILADIAAEEPRLTVVDEPRFGYGQQDTMMRLIRMAPEATWIVPFDADEWWFVDPAEGDIRIADHLAALPKRTMSTATRTWDMVPHRTDDMRCPDPFERMTMTRPGSFWSQPHNRKAAFRPGRHRVIMQGNHGIVGERPPEVGALRIRHYPFRSYEQARAKLRHGRAAIKAADLPDWSGTHWREWGAYSDGRLRRWWRDWTRPEGLVPWSPGSL